MRLCLIYIGLFLVQKGCSGSCSKRFTPKIAIVGGGISGASTAHFLTELFNGSLEIDIFEANKIGGRLATTIIGNDEYEICATLFHPANKYMSDFVKILGLEKIPIPKLKGVGIWDGEKYVLIGNDINSLLAETYGTAELSKLSGIIHSFLQTYANIYGKQEDGEAYNTVTDLLSSMSVEFPHLLRLSTAEYLSSQNFSVRIINEFITGIITDIYGQNLDIHSFVGWIALSCAEDGLWSVKGGNKKLPEQLISQNDKVRVIHSPVRRIRYLAPTGVRSQVEYEITYNAKAPFSFGIYDAVVVATPLTKNVKYPIQFMNIPEIHIPGNLGTYQRAQLTIVKGDIDPSYYGLNESIDSTISCNVNKTEITSVRRRFSVNGTSFGPTVWKVWTRKTLTDNQYHSLFSRVEEVKQFEFLTYPKYTTAERLDEFELYDSLYHVNAVEWAASTMEMSAIGGRNVALLIYRKLTTCSRDPFLISNQK